MTIALGVDTLSYHCRLVTGDIGLEDVLREVADLGAAFVQLNSVHLEGRSTAEIAALRALAGDLGLTITLAGGMVGRAGAGDTVAVGVERVREWAAQAEALGSPYVRVSSGFYRNELLAYPERITVEQQYVIDTLRRAVTDVPGDLQILLENHSDFTSEEYTQIIDAVGSDRVAVFLDMINPISALQDPLPVVRALAPLAPAGHAKDFRIESRYVEDGYHRRGFDVQWCYPGEGVADVRSLMGVLVSAAQDAKRDTPYLLSIEGLDNYPNVADQRQRLSASLEFLSRLLPAGARA